MILIHFGDFEAEPPASLRDRDRPQGQQRWADGDGDLGEDHHQAESSEMGGTCSWIFYHFLGIKMIKMLSTIGF